MNASEISRYSRLIKDLAYHFGSGTEIVIHDLTSGDPGHSIVAIENGHVTGRKIGDGPSNIVLKALKSDTKQLNDRLCYLTKTDDGKVLKSSTIYIRNDEGEAVGILGVNTDITLSIAMEKQLHEFHTPDVPDEEPEEISTHVADILDGLIDQSIRMIGKPPALMSKDEKIRAIRFLNESGAFLITKSGPKVCAAYGISKYTLYSYLDEAKSGS